MYLETGMTQEAKSALTSEGNVEEAQPVPLLLGMGWFPDQTGGLNRYLRDLLGAVRERIPGVRAVVLGPMAEAVPGVTAIPKESSFFRRLWHFHEAAKRAAPGTSLVDSHFALYTLLPIVFGKLRNHPLVVHFQGPWADESASTDGAGPWVVFAKRQVERAVYRRARRFVVLSGAFKQILEIGRAHV